MPYECLQKSLVRGFSIKRPGVQGARGIGKNHGGNKRTIGTINRVCRRKRKTTGTIRVPWGP